MRDPEIRAEELSERDVYRFRGGDCYGDAINMGAAFIPNRLWELNLDEPGFIFMSDIEFRNDEVYNFGYCARVSLAEFESLFHHFGYKLEKIEHEPDPTHFTFEDVRTETVEDDTSDPGPIAPPIAGQD